MKLILDTDPGIDDAMAYFYAHAHPDIDLIAMTTIFGNVTVDDATRNACWLTNVSKAATMVVPGASKPLRITPNHPSGAVHGPTGFGDVNVGLRPLPEHTETAVEYLTRMARRNPGQITLCAVGPLTNVALAIQKDPEFVSNLAQLVIMGGSLDAGGNVTAHAEANFWNDPHAADIVLKAQGSGRIVVVGLDVTTQIAFGADEFDTLAGAAPATGGFLRDIGQFYMRFYETVTGTYHCFLHDPAALIAAEDDGLFTMQDVRLEVVTSGSEIGRMQRRGGDQGRVCQVCMGVDAEAVLDRYTRIVSLND